MSGAPRLPGRRVLLAGMLAAGAKLLHAQEADRLYNPGAAGRARARTLPGDASAEIQAIEQKLTCHCGCTLDIFTCRTTDFTCTTSPRLHRQVVALYEGGADAQGVLDAFVAQYGERALMAPEPKGFNLAGYLLPGSLILLVGSILAWVIGRRFRLAGTEGPGPDDAAAAAATQAPDQPSAEARERLRQALAEVED